MLEYVIFAIDGGQNLHKRKKFMHYVDTSRAMSTISTVHQCIGMWEGKLEVSYMMLAKDYESHVQGREYVKHQACVMRVPGDTRQPCVLEFTDGTSVSIGVMREVTSEEAMTFPAWTYVEETGKYFVTGEEVPKVYTLGIYSSHSLHKH